MQGETVIFGGDEELSDGDLAQVSRDLIKEVSAWKLEAKAEDKDRYFYHVREVEAIENGERCYVIGRKGSGKTAISEYFSRLGDHDTFAEKLTFKNFPFNELYALKNEGYTRPNEYITLWKYLIYSSICKLMSKNENTDPDIKAKLHKLYGADHSTLSRRLSRWTGREFSLGILGVSLQISLEKEKVDDLPWIERVNILEDVVMEHIDTSRYYIVFDELDEDYREIIKESKYNQYTALITKQAVWEGAMNGIVVRG